MSFSFGLYSCESLVRRIRSACYVLFAAYARPVRSCSPHTLGLLGLVRLIRSACQGLIAAYARHVRSCSPHTLGLLGLVRLIRSACQGLFMRISYIVHRLGLTICHYTRKDLVARIVRSTLFLPVSVDCRRFLADEDHYIKAPIQDQQISTDLGSP